jgi:hypothetical protein
MMIPVAFDAEHLTAEWHDYAARRLGVPLEAVAEFVNGVLLATLLGAAGGAVFCDVRFVLGREISGGAHLPFTLHAGVQFTYPELEGPVADLAQEAREELSMRGLAAARRLDGLTQDQQDRFYVRYKWVSVERGAFEERWEGV